MPSTRNAQRGGGEANGAGANGRTSAPPSARTYSWVDHARRRNDQADDAVAIARSRIRSLSAAGFSLPGADPGFERLVGADGRLRSELVRASSAFGGDLGSGLGPWDSSRVLWLHPDLPGRERVLEPYREVWVIRSALKAFSQPFSRLPIQVWRGTPNQEGSTLITEHEVLRLLDGPNNYQTRSQFLQSHAINFKLDGESFLFLTDLDGKPIAPEGSNPLDPLPNVPRQIIPVRGTWVEHALDDATGQVVAYRYRRDTTSGVAYSPTFPVGSVVVLSDYDPSLITRGLGDVASLVNEIDLFHQARRSVNGSVRSGGDPGAWISYEKKYSPDERERRENQINDEMSGPNVPRYKLLWDGAKVTPNPVRPKDMMFGDTLDWSTKAMLAVIGVPPPCIGLLDDANYNRAEMAERQLWKGPVGIASFIAATEDVITQRLLRRVPVGRRDATRTSGQLHLAFDLSGVEALREESTGETRAKTTDSVLSICKSVSQGLLPKAAALEILVEGLGMDRDAAERIVDPLEEGAVGPSPSEPSSDQPAPPAASRSIARSSFRPYDPVPANAEVVGALVDYFASYERATISVWRSIAREQRTGRRPRLARADVDPGLRWLTVNQQEWEEVLVRMLEAPLHGVYSDALRGARFEWGGSAIAVSDPRVTAMVLDQQLTLASVPNTLAAEIQALVVRFFADSTSVETLAAQIAEALPELTEELRAVFGNKHRRADTIARTETGYAQNGSAYLQMGEARAATVEWLPPPPGEGRRENHQELRGVTVPYGTRFPNGLRHPHDPDAPASERINCACRLVVATFEGD